MVARDQAGALYQIAAEEQLFGGGLDRGEKQDQEGKREKCAEVQLEGESLRPDDKFHQAGKGCQAEPDGSPEDHAPPVYRRQGGDQGAEGALMDGNHYQEETGKQEQEADIQNQKAGRVPQGGWVGGDIDDLGRADPLENSQNDQQDGGRQAAQNQPDDQNQSKPSDIAPGRVLSKESCVQVGRAFGKNAISSTVRESQPIRRRI